MSKIWTKEDIVFDDIPSDIQLKDEYILKDELITVEDWVHEYIFDEGLFFDKRYDRRFLWTMLDCRRWSDSLMRGFHKFGYFIYVNVEESLLLAQQSEIPSVQNVDYFENILTNGISVTPPKDMVDIFQTGFDSITGSKYLTLDSKNRSIVTALMYLWDRKTYGKKTIRLTEIAVPKRKIASILYQRIGYGQAPNRMMIRIGELSTTGDKIDKKRDDFYDQELKLHIGYKKPVVRKVDLLDIFFTPDNMKKLEDLKFLLGSMVYLDKSNYGDTADDTFDDYYKYNYGDLTKFTTYTTFLKKFSEAYYKNVFNKRKVGDTRLKLRGAYMVMLLCKFLISHDYKVGRKWKEVSLRFHEWYKTRIESDDKVWNDGKDDHSFTATLSYWLTKSQARDAIIDLFVEEFFSELEKDNLVTPKSPKISLTSKQKIRTFKEGNSYQPKRHRRIDGQYKGVWFSDDFFKTDKKKKEYNEKYGVNVDLKKEHQEIGFQQIWDCDGDHVNPQDNGGKHELSNWELTTPEFNKWKSTKIMDYVKV